MLCKTSARDRPVSSLHVGSSWVTMSWPTFRASFAGGIWTRGLAVIVICTAFLSLSALFLPGNARVSAAKKLGHELHSVRECWSF